REIERAAVLSSHRASRHVAAPSLGHYASLSFIVIGRGQKSEEKRKGFSCGSGFSVLSLSKGSRDLAL
ncbi:MAG: hypothetical protein WBH05_13325, partial [Syntrophobacteria bacterium]